MSVRYFVRHTNGGTTIVVPPKWKALIENSNQGQGTADFKIKNLQPWLFYASSLVKNK